MATKLTKPVTRRMAILTDNRTIPRQQDMYDVTIYPNGLIGFRRLRGRNDVKYPISAVLMAAMQVAEKKGK